MNTPAATGAEPGYGTWRREFEHTDRVIRQARMWVDSRLTRCPVAEDVGLVAQELLSNAFRHTRSAGSSVIVNVVVRRGLVRVAVTDLGADTVPKVLPFDPEREGGRGLSLINGLTRGCWGVVEHPSGQRTVFGEITW